MEEEQEISVQNQLIEIGEIYAQKIREADKTSIIEQVMSKAYDEIDQ